MDSRTLGPCFGDSVSSYVSCRGCRRGQAVPNTRCYWDTFHGHILSGRPEAVLIRESFHFFFLKLCCPQPVFASVLLRELIQQSCCCCCCRPTVQFCVLCVTITLAKLGKKTAQITIERQKEQFSSSNSLIFWVQWDATARRSLQASIGELQNSPHTHQRSQQTKLRFALSKNVNTLMIAERKAVSCADERCRQTEPHILSAIPDPPPTFLWQRVADPQWVLNGFSHLQSSYYLLIYCNAIRKDAKSHHPTGTSGNWTSGTTQRTKPK